MPGGMGLASKGRKKGTRSPSCLERSSAAAARDLAYPQPTTALDLQKKISSRGRVVRARECETRRDPAGGLGCGGESSSRAGWLIVRATGRRVTHGELVPGVEGKRQKTPHN